MCFYQCNSPNVLMQHIIRHHQHDPKFKVQCKQTGCGRSFTKWKSFRQHLFRKHPTVQTPCNNEVEVHENINLFNGQDILLNNIIHAPIDNQKTIQPRVEILQLKSAQFAVNIRKNCKVSQKAMETMMEGVTNLVDDYLSILMGEINKSVNGEDETVKLTDIRNICTETYPPSTIFSSIQSKNNFDNVYRTVLDGCSYKNHEFFKNHEDALAIIFYYDDLVVGNLLGVAAKKHKLSMFYWTLANIKPEVRSSLNIIQLYAIVRTEHLKQPNGISKILAPFINDIVKLQTVGINIHVFSRTIKNFKGSVIFSAGDTPASAMLGGFKESVAAYRPCRTCMTTKDEWRQNFSTKNFILRNKTDHQEHVDVVSDASITNAAQEFWKTQYGINKQSPLAEKIFTLDQLNENIENFDFKHFQNDKPALILSTHLTEEGHLRQSAAQFLALFYALPFLIGEWIVENNASELEEQISCYMQMLDIIKVSLAYEIHEDTVDYLDHMIQVFLINFNHLYPNLMVPKFHFMMH
ncbi:GSCOCG00011602001-RA-CDS, partial [Cotesia congregata]